MTTNEVGVNTGPRSTEAIVPARILVDSGDVPPLGTITNGCIPNYPCGGDRVFYAAGPKVISDPPPGTVKWIWNGSKMTRDTKDFIFTV